MNFLSSVLSGYPISLRVKRVTKTNALGHKSLALRRESSTWPLSNQMVRVSTISEAGCRIPLETSGARQDAH